MILILHAFVFFILARAYMEFQFCKYMISWYIIILKLYDDRLVLGLSVALPKFEIPSRSTVKPHKRWLSWLSRSAQRPNAYFVQGISGRQRNRLKIILILRLDEIFLNYLLSLLTTNLRRDKAITLLGKKKKRIQKEKKQ